MSFPKTTFEERQEHYKDLESLIHVGFISHKIKIGNVDLCLRSPCKSDTFLIRNRANFFRSRNSKTMDWKVWTLATCTWMLNGYSLLEERNSAVEIYNNINILPGKTLNFLFNVYLGLYRRKLKSLRGIESYVHENISRRKWISLNGNLPSDPKFTGIPGTDRLGINIVQELWSALNQLEDDRLKFLKEWFQLRNTIAPHITKKAWKNLIAKDKSEQRNLQADKDRTQDLFFYRSIGALGWDEDFSNVKSTIQLRPKSVNELRQEMYNWVAGVKDEHDIVIDQFKEKIRKKKEDQQRAIEEKIRIAKEKYKPSLSSTPVAFTQEQMNETLARRRKRKPGVVPGMDFDQSQEKIYNISIKEEPRQGKLVARDGQILTRDQLPSLQEQVRSRKPKLKNKDG